MADVHVFSLKVGASHGLWQYKTRGSHDRVMMHGLQQILDAACRLLGFDSADRSTVYTFSFSPEPFPGSQVCLEKIREARNDSGIGCYYRVRQSTIGEFAAKGFFPPIVNTRYLHAWPERVYFKLERSLTGGIVD